MARNRFSISGINSCITESPYGPTFPEFTAIPIIEVGLGMLESDHKQPGKIVGCPGLIQFVPSFQKPCTRVCLLQFSFCGRLGAEAHRCVQLTVSLLVNHGVAERVARVV